MLTKDKLIQDIKSAKLFGQYSKTAKIECIAKIMKCDDNILWQLPENVSMEKYCRHTQYFMQLQDLKHKLFKAIEKHYHGCITHKYSPERNSIHFSHNYALKSTKMRLLANSDLTLSKHDFNTKIKPTLGKVQSANIWTVINSGGLTHFEIFPNVAKLLPVRDQLLKLLDDNHQSTNYKNEEA